jgi:TRAP-type C4-dicarboxylate transport system permease small subunit
MEIFARWFKKVNLWFAVGAMIAIGVMIVSTTADTTSRYALNYPLKGVFELNELLMVLVLFLVYPGLKQSAGIHGWCWELENSP